MDFCFTDEQSAFQEVPRGFARDTLLPHAARYLRDVRVHQIVEGTNEIIRLIIVRKLLGSIG